MTATATLRYPDVAAPRHRAPARASKRSGRTYANLRAMDLSLEGWDVGSFDQVDGSPWGAGATYLSIFRL